MAQYRFEGPDGKIHLFEGPRGLNQNDVNLFGNKFFNIGAPEPTPVAPEEPKGATGFIPSVMRGGRGISSLLGDVAPAMIGKAFGADEYAKKQMQEAATYQKETEKLYPAEVASYKDIDSVGKALTYIKESIGEAIPSILPSILTGGAAAMIGRPAIVAAEKAAQDFAAKEVARAAAKNILTQESIEGIKKAALDVGMKEAQRTALKYQAAGALTGSAAQNIPDVYQNIYEATGKEDLGAALAFGSFNAALDAITPVALLRKMSKAGLKPEEVAAAWYKRAGKGAAQGFVTEGGTEALQEVSSAAAEKFVDKNQQFFSEKNFERFINAGLKGGFGGAGITAATDVAFGKGPEAPITQTSKDQTQQQEQVEPPPPPPGTKTAPAFTGDEEFKIHPEGFSPPQPPAPIAGAATSLPSTPDIDEKQKQYDKREAEIAELKAKNGAPQHIQSKINKNVKLKAQIDAARTALAQAPTTGAEDVKQSVSGAGGEGAAVSGAASTNVPPAGGPQAIEPGGVVRDGEAVTRVDERENAQPAPLNLSPELQAAQDLLTAIDTGGVPLNPAKINQIARNIGLEVSKSAKPEETISRLREAVSRGSQTAPAAPAGPQVKSVQKDLDELNSLFGDDGLPSKGTARRTNAQIAADKDLDARLNELGQDYGLTRKKGETQREFAARIKDAGKYEMKRQAEATEGMADTQIPETETAKQELKKPTPYKNSITDEQRQMYDDMVEEYNIALETARKEAEEALKNKDKLTSTEAIKNNVEKAQANSVDQELPVFDNLTDDEARKYFGEHIVRNSYDEHLKAAQALSDYMSDKRFESRAAGKDTQTKEQNDADKAAAVAEVVAQDNYMSVRDEYGRKTGLSYRFPAWNALSQASKDLYQAINDVNSAMEQDMAFRAIKKQIQKELLDKQTEENIKEAKQQSYREMLVAAERARKGQPAGKGVLLPDNILKKLLSGDIAGVLKYLTEDGKGVKSKTPFGNMFSRQIFRLLASALQNIDNFKVNVVYDENMIYDDIGKYDANSNTFYFGPNGMDEATVLHELTHAATVKLIHQFYTDKSKLDARTVKAIEHLINVANLAKARLGSKYPNAFDNIYEFIAYAMTDLDFQHDLSQIQVESAATVTGQVKRTPYSQREQRQVSITGYDTMFDNLWNYFTGTLAYMYRLFYPRQRQQAILMPTELTGRPRGTKKEAATEAENIKALDKINRKLRKKGDMFAQEAEESTTGLKPGDVVPVNEDTAAKSPEQAGAEFKGLFDQEMEEEGRDELAPIYGELVDKGGVTNLKREILREPGFKGNLLLEAADVIQQLFAAPEGGITQLGGISGFGAELPSKGTAKTTKKATTPSAQTDAQITEKALGNVSIKERSAKSLLRNIFSRAGFDTAVEYFQNDRHPLKMLFDRARMFGVVSVIGEKANDVYNGVSRSIGMATNIYAKEMKPLADDVNAAVEAYAKKLNISVKDALSRLHLILQARHEPERRHIKFLLNVPLDDMTKRFQLGNEYYSASGFRQAVLDILSQAAPGLNDQQRTARAQKLRQMLETVVADPTSRQKLNAKGQPMEAAYFNEQNEMYNVVGGRSPNEIQAFRNTLDTKADKAEIDAVSDALRNVHKKTIDLNKEANYWSEPVANIVDFYGFNDYIPFKGRPGTRQIDEEFNFETRRIGGDYQDAQDRFEGRESESENPVLQSLADGATASLRAGRKDLPQTIVNAINAKIIRGHKVDTVTFADRFSGRSTKKDITGTNKIFLYKQDGTIDVYQIDDNVMAQSIKRSYRTSNPIWDRADMITSGIGQTHTRYNPAFAPMNFVRDAFTNAGIIGAEFDPITGGKLLTGMASDVANNGLARALNYSKLYADGKFDEINRLAGNGKPYESLNSKERYYRDLMDYVDMGGRVSYLQGVAAKGALDQLIKEVGRSGILRKKDQVDKFIDIYNDMFELSSRVAAYRLLKDQYYHENLGNKMSEADAKEDARIRAVEYAKNLANFEQVGKWGKQAGALFMFFRPAATGAVRAIQALSPAFSFNEENFRKEAQAEGRTPQQIERAVAIMQKRQYAARRMMVTMTGIGVAFYMMALMMAGDDEEGRNRVAIDDMARWTRYARFFIPGLEKPIQIPWGFGPGAFASAGSQIASIGSGRVSIGEALSNIVTVGLDSFLPLPFSRISPVENFPAWAMDSVTPSAFRPFFEYVMNMDGLGREIYNNRQTRYGDAYTGGDSIPEAYKMAARALFDATDGAIDWSPNTMYFFANNYFDGMAKMATAATNLSYTVTGDKDFDPKNDLPFIGSFIGTKSNVDAREFSKVEDQIKAIDKRINSLKDKPEALERYLEANPNAYGAVEFYNAQVNGQLREVRAVANQVRANGELTPRERKLQLEEINGISSTIKRQLLNLFEELDIKP